MTIDGVDYYSADEDGVMYFQGDVVFNLTRTPNLPSAAIYPELHKHFDMPFREVMVPWPDFSLPRVKLSFWKALHTVVKRKKWKTVCIHCGHGHGRTGTAMSALLVANLRYTPLEAVNFVRHNHCEEAVETSAQCNYLMEIDMHYNKRVPLEEESKSSNETNLESEATRSGLPSRLILAPSGTPFKIPVTLHGNTLLILVSLNGLLRYLSVTHNQKY